MFENLGWRIGLTSKLLQHLLAGRISSGYPPDEIRFVANERRAPFLANVRLAFPRCSVHLIDWKRRLTLIGHKSGLIGWISTGGICDFRNRFFGMELPNFI